MKRRDELPEWRRALQDAGLPMTWIAPATGKSYNTVRAYASGKRRAPEEWQARVIELAKESVA